MANKKLSRACKLCGRRFFKPASCGVPEWTTRRKFCSPKCKKESQVGVPSPKKGKVYPHLRYSTSPGIPCRICGERATKYNDPGKLGLITCGKPECKEASRLLKNKNISKSLSELIRNGDEIGTRWINDGKSYSVSPEENVLWPVLEKYGFQRQVSFPTHRVKPTHFMMDFAHTARKLYVEVDGPSHRPIVNQLKDAKRDLELAEAGWRGIRIPSMQIKQNLKIVIRRIERFAG